jgi:hypothetical protein
MRSLLALSFHDCGSNPSRIARVRQELVSVEMQPFSEPGGRLITNPLFTFILSRLPHEWDQPVADFFRVVFVAFQFPVQESFLERAPHCQHCDGNDCQQGRRI